MVFGVSISSSGFKYLGIRWGVFVISEKEKGWYHFGGATLAGERYKPNDFCWHRYCAFAVNAGIAVAPDRVALLENGKEKIVVNGQFSHIASRISSFEKYPEYNLDYDKPAWVVLLNELGQLESHDRGAKEMLSVIRDWENHSRQTAEQVVKNIESQYQDIGPAELCVAGTQWLLCDSSRNWIVMGDGDRVWGKTTFRGNEFLGVASPVHNGWFIQLTRTRRYLFKWDGHKIQTQKVDFPFGKWERWGQWTFWSNSNVILTPTGHAVITPPANLSGINSEGAFFYAPHLGGIVLIDEMGKQHRRSLPKEHRNDCVDLLVGNQSMLALCYSHPRYYLAITSTACRQRSWNRQAFVAFPVTARYYARVLKGEPDVFVFIFRTNSSKGWRVFLIDAHSNLWLFPFALNFPVDSNDLVVTQANNQVIIRQPDQQNGQTNSPVAKIGLLANRAYIQFDDDISFFGQVFRLPNQPKALWEYLRTTSDI